MRHFVKRLTATTFALMAFASIQVCAVDNVEEVEISEEEAQMVLQSMTLSSNDETCTRYPRCDDN